MLLTSQPTAAGLALAPVPGQTAFLGKRMRAAEPDAELLQLGLELEAAWSKEMALCERIEDDELAEKLLAEAYEATKGIVEKIELLPATTFAGLKIKARACLWTHCGEPIENDFFGSAHTTDLRLGAGILRDLLTIGDPPDASIAAAVAAA